MATTIRLQDWTKAQLDELIDAEDHASYDSAVKSLLKEYTLTQRMPPTDNPASTRIDSAPRPLAATDSLPAESGSALWGPELYLGGIGAGKTVTAAYQLHRLLERESPPTVFIVAPLGGYERFTATHDGEHIRYRGAADEIEQSLQSSSIHLFYYDLETLPLNFDPEVLETVLEAVYKQAAAVDGRAVLLVDEAQLLFDSELLTQLLTRLFRHGRQREISVRVVSQFPTPELATDFVPLATRVYLHALPTVAPEVATQLGLTPSHREYVKGAATGATGESTEVLVRDGSTGWQPWTVDIAPDVLEQLVERQPMNE